MMISAQFRFATTGVSTELRARADPDGAAPRPLGDRATAGAGLDERCGAAPGGVLDVRCGAPPAGVFTERCPLGRGCCTVDGPLGRGCCAVDGPLDRRCGVVVAMSDDPRCCGCCGPDGRGCERAGCGGSDGAGA